MCLTLSKSGKKGNSSLENENHAPKNPTNGLMFQGRDQAPDLKYVKCKVEAVVTSMTESKKSEKNDTSKAQRLGYKRSRTLLG